MIKYYLLLLGAAFVAIAISQEGASSRAFVIAERKPVPLVSIDLQAKYYKEWGELQSKMGQFQSSLTAPQKALQDDIRARTEVVNRVKDELVKVCDGNLNYPKLMQENIIECKVPGEAEGVKP